MEKHTILDKERRHVVGTYIYLFACLAPAHEKTARFMARLHWEASSLASVCLYWHRHQRGLKRCCWRSWEESTCWARDWTGVGVDARERSVWFTVQITSFHTQSEQSTFFRQRTMASDFEVLILIPADSQSAANFSSACRRSPTEEAGKTTSSAKSRDVILRLLSWTQVLVLFVPRDPVHKN